MNKKILIGGILGFFALILLLGGVYKILAQKNLLAKSTLISPLIAQTASPAPSIKIDKTLNVLLLGMGGEGHDGPYLTDSMTLISLNLEKNAVNIISIPRDIWISGDKINAAYSKGGGDSAKSAVEDLTGIQVNYFLAIDFNSFTKFVDNLGGIDVAVPKSFDDFFYPISGKENDLCGFTAEENALLNQKYTGFDLEKQYSCRYEHLHFDKGLTHMNGETALKFVRSRHSVEYGTDFARGERAQAVLLGIGKAILNKRIFEASNTIFPQLTNLVKSDINLDDIPAIMTKFKDIDSYKIINTYLTDQNVLVASTSSGGAYILIPKAGDGNFSAIKSFIADSWGN